MERRLTVTGANIVFLVFVLLFMFFQVILAILTMIYGGDFLRDNVYGISLISEFLFILLPVLIYTIAKKLNFKEVFRFNKLEALPAVLIIFLSIPAYFVALLLNNAVVYLLQFIGNIPSQPIPVPQNYRELLTGILIIAVSPAICEEMLHRGLLLKAYEKRGSLKAVAITAFFFGIFHFDITNLAGPVFLGLLIGYYVIRTNSIFAGMLAHFLNNAIAELLQYFSGVKPTDTNISLTLEELGYLVTYGIAGFIIVWFLIVLFKKATTGKVELKPAISAIRNDIRSVVSHWPVIVILVLYIIMLGLFLLSIAVSLP